MITGLQVLLHSVSAIHTAIHTMQIEPESLRYILGLKLRKFRQKKGLGLKEMAAKTGLSISYLSEIEKGKKYPKPEKLLALATALEVPFDELVSLKVDEELGPVTDIFGSPFMREFPFHLYGIEMERLLGLVTEAPSKAAALVRTALEIGQTYGAQVEHLLLAALRSYQHMHQNYFEEIEDAASAFLSELELGTRSKISRRDLERVLERDHGVAVVYETFEDFPALRGLRSVRTPGRKPRLLVNDRLLPDQKAFALAREIGFLRLGLKERSFTSSPLKVESFDQVINDFKAAYFAGAAWIPRDPLIADVETFLGRKRWSASALIALVTRYRTTPETFCYRLSHLLPRFFGLKELYFLRFNHRAGSERFALTKILNMSQLPIVHGLEPDEHYCRRWPGVRLLAASADGQAGEAPSSDPATGAQGDVTATAQRSTFLAQDTDFFVVTLTRPLALTRDTHSSISLGLAIDRTFKRRVRFWNDPNVRQVEVHLTCERCGLSADECSSRAAPPRLHDEDERLHEREAQLARLLEGG